MASEPRNPTPENPERISQDWLTLEGLPVYTPELNPVEMLWSALKAQKLANPAGAT